MMPRVTPFELASAIGHGHIVPAESLEQVQAVLSAYGGDPGDVIVRTLRCEPGCPCGGEPTFLLERTQRGETTK
jgi:hypothetical protein